MYGTGSRGSGSTLEFLIGGVILVLFFLIFGRGGRRKQKAMEATAQWVASRVGGRAVPAQWPTPPRIEFSASGRSAFLDWVKDGGPDGMTRVTVDLRGCSPGSLSIGREGLASSLLKRLGRTDIEIGDPEVDRKYLIRANPESVAQRFFDPARRRQVVAALRQLDPFPSPALDLTREALGVRVGRYLMKDAELVALARATQSITEYILAMEPVAGVFWIESPTGPAQCQVCGGVLETEVVSCSKCRTPHHRDCWGYNGRCSTYACGETQCL